MSSSISRGAQVASLLSLEKYRGFGETLEVDASHLLFLPQEQLWEGKQLKYVESKYVANMFCIKILHWSWKARPYIEMVFLLFTRLFVKSRYLM